MDLLADYVDVRGPELAAPERLAYAGQALGAFWSGKTADQVPGHLMAYRQTRNVSDGTLRRELGVLRAALNHAVQTGVMIRAIAVPMPPPPPPKDRFLQRNEVAALIRAARREPKARSYLPLFILLGYYTGQRKGAILSLRWSQVDLSARRIDFNSPGRRQTNKRRPRIPMPAKLYGHLSRLRKRAPDIAPVLHLDGQPLADLKKSFASACKRADLADVTPHTLRHTAAIQLMKRGVKTWEAAGYLGMSEEMLVRVYGHHHPDYLRGAAEAL
ncbi:MAG: site-specific integrase [Pseudomonadota bacterium]